MGALKLSEEEIFHIKSTGIKAFKCQCGSRNFQTKKRGEKLIHICKHCKLKFY